MSEYRVNKITSRDGLYGPKISGIVTFSSNSGMVIPSGATINQYVPEAIYPHGLNMYYDPGNDNSYVGVGTVIYDLASNNFSGVGGFSTTNGLIYGSPTFVSNPGYFTITTDTQYIDLQTGGKTGQVEVEGGQQYTFEGWFYLDSTSSQHVPFARYDSNAFGPGGLNIYIYRDAGLSGGPVSGPKMISSFVADTSDNRNVKHTQANVVPYDQWVHMAFVYDFTYNAANDARIYINGVETPTVLDTTFGTNHSSMPTHVPGPSLKIGRSVAAGGISTPMIGRVGKFSVYGVALSQSQVYQNYLAHKDRYLP